MPKGDCQLRLPYAVTKDLPLGDAGVACFLNRPSCREKRHEVEANASASAQELLAKQVSKCDEAEISKLLLEICLLDSAYQRSSASGDPLMDAAKRYRVDTEKIGKAVAEAFALKQKERKAAATKKTKPEPTVKTAPAGA